MALLTGFKLVDGKQLRIEIDCEANTAWVLAQSEKAPDMRSIIHIAVEGEPTQEEITEVCNQFANAACKPGETVISPAGIIATVEMKTQGASLEIVRLKVDKK